MRVQLCVVGVLGRQHVQARLSCGNLVAACRARRQGIHHGELREYADQHQGDGEQTQLRQQIATLLLGVYQVDGRLDGVRRRLAALQRAQRHLLLQIHGYRPAFMVAPMATGQRRASPKGARIGGSTSTMDDTRSSTPPR